MGNDCSELEELNRLLSEGYLIAGPTDQVARLRRPKTLLIMSHPKTGHSKQLLISDAATIEQAIKQIGYQNEQVGARIIARCVSVDNTPHTPDERQAYHGLDQLVASLNGLWEWHFATDKEMPQAFGVEISLMSVEPGEIEAAKNRLKELLDYLAITRKVGFYVQDLAVGPIRRCSPYPYIHSVGPEGRLLDALSAEEIKRIGQVLSTDKNRIAARGLNQAYCENFLPSKLSILWAAAEGVFTTDATNLLSRDETEKLLAAAEEILTDTNKNRHKSRLKKLADFLENPERLPLIGRNERMAESMAEIIGLTKQEAYDKLKVASELRGKHLHKLQRDWSKLRKSVEFLEMALQKYLLQ